MHRNVKYVLNVCFFTFLSNTLVYLCHVNTFLKTFVYVLKWIYANSFVVLNCPVSQQLLVLVLFLDTVLMLQFSGETPESRRATFFIMSYVYQTHSVDLLQHILAVKLISALPQAKSTTKNTVT